MMPKPDPLSPSLSVIVAVVSDTIEQKYDLSHLEGCLKALQEQEMPPEMEIIVPYPAQTGDMDHLRAAYPTVCFLPQDNLKTYPPKGSSREHHDELRARGLAAASGEVVALLEDHARPGRDWCKNAVLAIGSGAAGVGGAIENGIDRSLNWAVYFCDFGKYQNPISPGETTYASDANIAYKRSVLERIQPVWAETFHEPDVNGEILSQGEKLVLSPHMIVYQYRKNLTFRTAMQERFVWGRSFAVTRIGHAPVSRRLVYALLSFLLPFILVSRMAINVIKKRRNLGVFLKAFPMTVLLTGGWSFGELTGYLTSSTGSFNK